MNKRLNYKIFILLILYLLSIILFISCLTNNHANVVSNSEIVKVYFDEKQIFCYKNYDHGLVIKSGDSLEEGERLCLRAINVSKTKRVKKMDCWRKR